MGAPAKPDEIHRDDEQMNTSLVANRADPEVFHIPNHPPCDTSTERLQLPKFLLCCCFTTVSASVSKNPLHRQLFIGSFAPQHRHSQAGPGGESEEVEDAVVDGRRQNPQELSFLYKSHDMVLLSRIGLFCTYALVAYAGYRHSTSSSLTTGKESIDTSSFLVPLSPSYCRSYNVISSLRDAEAERHEFAWAVAGIFVWSQPSPSATSPLVLPHRAHPAWLTPQA